MRITARRIQHQDIDMEDILDILNKEKDKVEIVSNITIMATEVEYWEDLVHDVFDEECEKIIVGLKSGLEIIILCNYDNFSMVMEKIYYEKMSTFNKVKLN